jgi:hypothetical protein
MKKADNFNAGKWLVENKITTQSRLNENESVDILTSSGFKEGPDSGNYYYKFSNPFSDSPLKYVSYQPKSNLNKHYIIDEYGQKLKTFNTLDEMISHLKTYMDMHQSGLNEIEAPSNLSPLTKKKFDTLLIMAEKAVANKDKETLYKIYNKGLNTGSKGWGYFIDSLVDKGLARVDDRGMLKWSFEGPKLNEEEGTDILSFLKSNKQELLDKLATKFKYDEDDMEFMSEYEIGIGADVDGNEDAEIAGLGEAGLDFSFNPKKVKDTGWYGDSSNFKLVIAGKPIYGISYNM